MSSLTHTSNRLSPLIDNTRKLLKEGYYDLKQYSRPEIPNTRKTIAAALKESLRFPVVAELKFASPTMPLTIPSTSKIAKNRLETFIPTAISGLSILTEPHFFHGSLGYLVEASAMFPQKPILMKDFIISTRQIDAGKSLGASSILLIAKILSREEIIDLMDYSRNLGLEVLLEVNNSVEMEFALDTDTDVIGINNRDLETFETDLKTTERLLSLFLNRTKSVLSLSGICTKRDAFRMKRAGADGILVGTALARASDPNYLITELKDV